MLEGRAEGPLAPLFAPLLAAPDTPDGCLVIGRLAQTLDGRIATRSGSSQWIGGPGDLMHTHRLRALCDVVLVGAATVANDDPQLTTRLVPGPDPVRVILDTRQELPLERKVFQGGPRTILAVAEDAARGTRHGTADILPVPRCGEGRLHLPALLASLAAQGLTRIFVEGGGITVSRFLIAGLIDRLHVTVAPIILGSGRPAFALPEAARISDGLKLSWTCHDIAPDVLFDMAVNRARPPMVCP
ncbi:RibD family protein [Rhodovarius crocodyli]|uniref:RibD family protein n=1 Tax=Rhodovarius crocodyli TaxID=1979269 RepID=A0A437MPU8_9PROT|nr:RibD family protein [Rhodovarius crocodyli]